MKSNILYFSKNAEFFLCMVDAIEEEALRLKLPLYRERRRRDRVIVSLIIENRMYPISFTVRGRPNKSEMEIVGRFTIGNFASENMYIFGVHTRDKEFGSSLQITVKQSLVWEMFTTVENKGQVRSAFLKILQTFYAKAHKIDKEWNAYNMRKKRHASIRQLPQRKALE